MSQYQRTLVAAERADTLAAAERILNRADAEHRNLTPSETIRFNEAQADLDRLDGQLADLDAREARAKSADGNRAKFASISQVGRAKPESALRALARGEVRSLDIDLRDITSHVDPSTGRRELRDLTVGSATAGGNTVPTSFAARLYEHVIESSGIRQTNVSVIRTDGGEDLQLPTTTTHPTASLITEGGSIGESDPVFGQVTLNAFKYGFLTQVSSELLQDNSVDLEGYLARAAARAINNGAGTHFVTGDGSGKPRGVVTGATVGKTGGTGQSGVPTADEIIDTYFSVLPEYRSRGFWLMSDATLAEVRKLKDTQDRYLIDITNGLGAGAPMSLMGRPVVVDPNVADAAIDAKSIAFGDFSAYTIREAGALRIEASTDFAYDTDLVTFRFLWRLDGDLLDTSAVKTYVGGAS